VYQFEQNDPSPFNLTVEEMGEVRYKEMLTVEKTLHLSSMTVLDFPDGG
jgi:hypothetical protein